MSQEVIVELEELKSLLKKEIQDLKDNLEHSHHDNVAINRLLSRIAQRNDIIRINTLRWVLELIERLEQK
jgi:hypothetical protein